MPPAPPFERDQPCADALLSGRLIADERWGVAIASELGVQKVRWPHGYFARVRDRLELVSPSNEVVARIGDWIELGGGSTPGDEEFIACDPRLPP